MIKDETKVIEAAKAIQNEIAQSPAPDAKLILVSKGQGAEAILPLLRAGFRDFGENRLQEARKKWPALRAEFPDVRLHYIGPLQSKKVKEVLALFQVIHSVDRPKLADALVDAAKTLRADCQYFLQVNIGREPQKSGVMPENLLSLLQYCQKIGLAPAGLMCLPPYDEDPEKYFQQMKNFGDLFHLKNLSMGMSDDYQTALHYGATHIRVGRKIFAA